MSPQVNNFVQMLTNKQSSANKRSRANFGEDQLLEEEKHRHLDSSSELRNFFQSNRQQQIVKPSSFDLSQEHLEEEKIEADDDKRLYSSNKESAGFFHPDPMSNFDASQLTSSHANSMSRSKVTDTYVKELLKNN